MIRIKKEYEDYSYDSWELTPEDKEESLLMGEWNTLLPSELEDAYDKLTDKQKVRLVSKYSEKRYIP